MARGDVHWFEAATLSAWQGVSFNLATDVLKMGIVTNATVPTVGTNDPRWGAGGTTNFSSNQVPTATAYTGPITVGAQTWSRASGVSTLDFNDITIAQDASGFTTAYWGILYDDTLAGKYALGYVDLGGPVSIVGGALNITINASGFHTKTAT